jgi:hypothetical protein
MDGLDRVAANDICQHAWKHILGCGKHCSRIFAGGIGNCLTGEHTSKLLDARIR